MFPCVFTEELWASQSMSSMTATTDNNHGIIFTYLYKKKVFSLRKKTVLHFHCTVHQKTNKNTKRRCKLYSIPCFFSLPENTFHYCLFTLDRQANNLTMCQSHWTWLLWRVRLQRVWGGHQAWDIWRPFEAVIHRSSFQAALTEICPVLSFVWSPPSEAQVVESQHGWSCGVSPNGRS